MTTNERILDTAKFFQKLADADRVSKKTEIMPGVQAFLNGRIDAYERAALYMTKWHEIDTECHKEKARLKSVKGMFGLLVSAFRRKI